MEVSLQLHPRHSCFCQTFLLESTGLIAEQSHATHSVLWLLRKENRFHKRYAYNVTASQTNSWTQHFQRLVQIILYKNSLTLILWRLLLDCILGGVEYISASLITTKMYKFKILVSDYLSSVFLQSSYQLSEHRPAHILQHQCSNFLAKYPTTHREVGHLSNKDIKVKIFFES